MQCEMCGSSKELRMTLIEGVKMNVCTECAKYGKVLIEKPKAVIHERTRYQAKQEEYIDEIVSDFSEKIKNAVNSKQIQEDALAKRIGMKESVLKAYIKGSIKPSLDDAKQLEKFFSITLIERIKDNIKPSLSNTRKSADLTIGDMIKIRKRQ